MATTSAHSDLFGLVDMRSGVLFDCHLLVAIVLSISRSKSTSFEFPTHWRLVEGTKAKFNWFSNLSTYKRSIAYPVVGKVQRQILPGAAGWRKNEAEFLDSVKMSTPG